METKNENDNEFESSQTDCKEFNDFDFLSRSSWPFWMHIHTPAQFVNAWFICPAWTLYLAEFIFVNVVLGKSKDDSYLFMWHLSDSGLGGLRNTHCSKLPSGLLHVFYGQLLKGLREFEGKMSFGKRISLKNSQEQMELGGAKTFFGFDFGDLGALPFFQAYKIGTKQRLVWGKQGWFSSSLLFHDTFQGDRIFRAHFKWSDIQREFAEERRLWRSRVQLRKGLWPRLPCLQIIFSHFQLHESTSQSSE